MARAACSRLLGRIGGREDPMLARASAARGLHRCYTASIVQHHRCGMHTDPQVCAVVPLPSDVEQDFLGMDAYGGSRSKSK